MRKNDHWRNRILQEAEQRNIGDVLRPAMATLAESRRRLLDQTPDQRSGDHDTVALFQAELARMETFEARLNLHLQHTRNRFAQLTHRR